MARLGTSITVTVLLCFAWLAFVLGFMAVAPPGFDIGQELTIFLVSGIAVAVLIAVIWLRWFLH